MRFAEISSGIQMALSNDEFSLIEKIRLSNEPYMAKELSDYEREIAKKLIQKDILCRASIDDKLYYVYIEMESWR